MRPDMLTHICLAVATMLVRGHFVAATACRCAAVPVVHQLTAEVADLKDMLTYDIHPSATTTGRWFAASTSSRPCPR